MNTRALSLASLLIASTALAQSDGGGQVVNAPPEEDDWWVSFTGDRENATTYDADSDSNMEFFTGTLTMPDNGLVDFSELRIIFENSQGTEEYRDTYTVSGPVTFSSGCTAPPCTGWGFDEITSDGVTATYAVYYGMAYTEPVGFTGANQDLWQIHMEGDATTTLESPPDFTLLQNVGDLQGILVTDSLCNDVGEAWNEWGGQAGESEVSGPRWLRFANHGTATFDVLISWQAPTFTGPGPGDAVPIEANMAYTYAEGQDLSCPADPENNRNTPPGSEAPGGMQVSAENVGPEDLHLWDYTLGQIPPETAPGRYEATFTVTVVPV